MAIGTLMAAGTAALGAGQKLAGMLKRNKAEGMSPSLVDPNQQAMANMTKRMLRANMTGTSNIVAQKQGSAIAKMMKNKSITQGGRSLAPISNLINTQAQNIASTAAQERVSLLNVLNQQVNNMADRKMDLQALRQTKLEAQAADLEKAGGENFLSGVGTVMTGVKPDGPIESILKGGRSNKKFDLGDSGLDNPYTK